MRKLCLGGSFNPIHHGHLLCGLLAMEQLVFERLVLIPTRRPPIKAPGCRYGIRKRPVCHV